MLIADSLKPLQLEKHTSQVKDSFMMIYHGSRQYNHRREEQISRSLVEEGSHSCSTIHRCNTDYHGEEYSRYNRSKSILCILVFWKVFFPLRSMHSLASILCYARLVSSKVWVRQSHRPDTEPSYTIHSSSCHQSRCASQPCADLSLKSLRTCATCAESWGPGSAIPLQRYTNAGKLPYLQECCHLGRLHGSAGVRHEPVTSTARFYTRMACCLGKMVGN